MRIGGRHEWNAELVRDVRGDRRAFVLKADAVVLNLDVEVFGELLAEPLRDLLRFLRLVLHDVLIEFARETAAQADQPLAVSFEHFAVDPRVAVEAFKVRDAR